jgi:hypothetical protein
LIERSHFRGMILLVQVQVELFLYRTTYFMCN